MTASIQDRQRCSVPVTPGTPGLSRTANFAELERMQELNKLIRRLPAGIGGNLGCNDASVSQLKIDRCDIRFSSRAIDAWIIELSRRLQER